MEKKVRHLPDLHTILFYEVHSSWWAGYISNNYLKKLAGKYFAWKVQRKYKRFISRTELGDKLRKEGLIKM